MEIMYPSQDDQLKVNALKGILSHRMEVLKTMPKNVHSIFISLQGLEDTCNKALT